MAGPVVRVPSTAIEILHGDDTVIFQVVLLSLVGARGVQRTRHSARRLGAPTTTLPTACDSRGHAPGYRSDTVEGTGSLVHPARSSPSRAVVRVRIVTDMSANNDDAVEHPRAPAGFSEGKVHLAKDI